MRESAATVLQAAACLPVTARAVLSEGWRMWKRSEAGHRPWMMAAPRAGVPPCQMMELHAESLVCFQIAGVAFSARGRTGVLEFPHACDPTIAGLAHAPANGSAFAFAFFRYPGWL